MAKELNRIGLCSPTLDRAQSAQSISPCLNSLRPHEASTASRHPVRRAMQPATPHCTLLSLGSEGPCALPSLPTTPRRVGSVESPRHTLISVSLARRLRQPMPCIEAPAKGAARHRLSSGSTTTRSATRRTSIAGLWPRTTDSRQISIWRCWKSSVASALYAEKPKPRSTVGQERNSDWRLTTVMRRDAFADFSARRATESSAFSRTTSGVTERQLSISSGTIRRRPNKGGPRRLPSPHRGGQ